MDNRDQLIEKIWQLEQVKKELQSRVWLKDLFTFNQKVLHVEEGPNMVELVPFHKEMCDFVMGKGNKKMMLVPRGHLKSTLVTIGYSLLRIVENPDVRILIANATYDMACSFLSQIKKHLQYNETLREYYGDLSTNADKWSENMITIPKFKPFTKKEATCTAYGMGGNLVSQHYDLIIGDDLVNRDFINTTEQIEKTVLFYKDALDLLEPTGKFIIIGTRWSDADLYGWIMDKGNTEQVYKNFDIMMKRAYEGSLETGENLEILFPEKYTREILKILKTEKGPVEFCTPAETPILMADWTIKPIKDVRAGDMIVGWTRGVQGNSSKLVPSRVISKFQMIGQVNDLVMTSGRKVRCTKEHKWYTSRLENNPKGHKPYKKAGVGSKLQFVCPVNLPELTQREKDLWNYLAGIFDGEGSAKSGGCLTITQGMDRNIDIWDKIRRVLGELNLDYTATSLRRTKDRHLVGHLWLKDNFETHLKFIRYTELAKKQQLIDRLFRNGKHFIKEEDRVVEIREGRSEEVFSLETESGNYIAWGYASSNSAQYMNEPLPQESAKFKVDWLKTTLEDELKVRELNYFTMVDPAIGQRKESDKTAIVTIAVDQWNNWFVVNIVWDNFLPSDIINHIFWNWESYHPKRIGVEMTAYQKSLQYALIDEMRRRNIFLPVVELKAERSKPERIEGLIPRYANGTIFHLEQCPFREQLEDQLMRYPVGKHDDIIDALAYGLQIAHQARKKETKWHHQRHGNDDWGDKQESRYLY